MARIRTIKPELWTDEKIVAMTPLARLLFIGMLNFVDDEGRAAYSPTRLKMQVLPADSADPSELLGEIRREGLIVVYAVDGKEYFQICNFSKHQKVDKRTASKIPSPPNPAESRRFVPTEGIKEGIKEGKGKDKRADARAADDYAFKGTVVKLNQQHFDLWTKAYPQLDLMAELTARDAWLSSPDASDEDRQKWFYSTPQLLANRNQRAKAIGKYEKPMTEAERIEANALRGLINWSPPQ